MTDTPSVPCYALPVYHHAPFFEDATQEAIQTFLRAQPTTRDGDPIVGVEVEFNVHHRDPDDVSRTRLVMVLARSGEGRMRSLLHHDLDPACVDLFKDVCLMLSGDRLSEQSVSYTLATLREDAADGHDSMVLDHLFRLRVLEGYVLFGYEYPGTKVDSCMAYDSPAAVLARYDEDEDGHAFLRACCLHMAVSWTSAHQEVRVHQHLDAWVATAREVLIAALDQAYPDITVVALPIKVGAL